MENCFKIKNIDFIYSLNHIDRIKDINLYRFIEKLIYDEHPKEIINKCSDILYNKDITELLNFIRENFLKNKTKCFNKINKRKNIKENMLENYVIKINQNRDFLRELNLKIFFKTIPNKNIIIENGDIVDIIF